MDIFSKLNTLKSIEPSESWVVEARKEVLSEVPAVDKKSNLGFNIQNLFQNLSFQKLMVPAFSLVFVLSTGVFTFGASKSSLPGEFLYSIKMINEDMALVVASEDKKAEIEMEHAGKRLEEMAVISKKTSDVEQQEKIGQLMERFEEKVSSANNSLTKIDKSVKKTKIAKTINTQSEKYAEVLAKTTDDLPAVVQDEILEEVAKAVDSNEKIYLTSLAVITDDDSEEDQNDGDVLGDEDCICAVDDDAECVCEEAEAEAEDEEIKEIIDEEIIVIDTEINDEIDDEINTEEITILKETQEDGIEIEVDEEVSE
jgi:hypothetical protein